MNRFLIAVTTALMLPSAASAQEYDALLIPLAPQRITGAFGSEWVTDLAVTNHSDTPIQVTRDAPDFCQPCLAPPLPPHATAFVRNPSVSTSVRGMLLFVEKGRLQDVDVTLRSRDVSRQHETWGTGIPVVGPHDLFGRIFGLVDVPMESQFRAMLRIYDVNADTPPRVRVRVYALTPNREPVLPGDADELLLQFEPSFAVPQPGETQIFPASVEIPLWLNPTLAARGGRVRIEIEPLDGAPEYWGFVSVTHNATQHVTIITP